MACEIVCQYQCDDRVNIRVRADLCCRAVLKQPDVATESQYRTHCREVGHRSPVYGVDSVQIKPRIFAADQGYNRERNASRHHLPGCFNHDMEIVTVFLSLVASL